MTEASDRARRWPGSRSTGAVAAVLAVAALSIGCSIHLNPNGGTNAVIKVLGAALGRGIDGLPEKVSEGISDEEARAKTQPADVTVRPFSALVPDPLRVGEPVALSLRPLLGHGAECLGCTLRWHSSNVSIARLSEPDPPCERSLCAELRPLAVGEVELTVQVCPSFFTSCHSETVRRHVVQAVSSRLPH